MFRPIIMFRSKGNITLVSNHNVMKVRMGVEEKLCAFLNSALHGNESFTLVSVYLIPEDVSTLPAL
jgi:hypothetical protein